MTTTTTTVAKPKAAKKTAAKKLEQKTVFHYAILLQRVLAGELGFALRNYYRSAGKYHVKQGTVFPRPRLANVALMTPEAAEAWLIARKNTSIPSGDDEGQRLYDEMVKEAKAAG